MCYHGDKKRKSFCWTQHDTKQLPLNSVLSKSSIRITCRAVAVYLTELYTRVGLKAAMLLMESLLSLKNSQPFSLKWLHVHHFRKYLCTWADFRFQSMTLLTQTFQNNSVLKIKLSSSSPLNACKCLMDFLDIFTTKTYALSHNKAKFLYLVTAGNNGCYLGGFHLEDTED